jgi:hypothetical protein
LTGNTITRIVNVRQPFTTLFFREKAIPNSFNVCTIHRLVEIFTHVWVADNEQVYLSSYATKEKACSICLKVAKESFTALWEKQHPPSSLSVQ